MARRNVRFSTYASWWIRQSITRALVNSRRAIRLPHRKEELLKRVQRTYNSLTQVLQREPNSAEIAAELNIPTGMVEAVMGMSTTLVSLDAAKRARNPAPSPMSTRTTRTAPTRSSWKPAPVTRPSGCSRILLEKEKKILLYRFEFCDGEKYTLKRIGAELGISPETVRQIEKRALRKLKDNAPEMMGYNAF